MMIIDGDLIVMIDYNGWWLTVWLIDWLAGW